MGTATPLNKFRIEVVGQGTVDVTRGASVDTQYQEVQTNVQLAPAFICFVNSPGASPELSHQTPIVDFAISSGVVNGRKRAVYDPTTGVVRCFVESSAVNPNYATAETWRFTFYLLNIVVAQG